MAIPRNAEGEYDEEARAARKRRWLLRSEREVLEWFGLPSYIDAEGEKEVWQYQIQDGVDSNGDPNVRGFWITLNRGRLTDLGD